LDGLTSASVATFESKGGRIACGGFATDKRSLQVFDVEYPGRDEEACKLGKSTYSSNRQKGIVSSISFSPLSNACYRCGNVFVIGACFPGCVYLCNGLVSSGSDVAGNCDYNAIVMK